MGLEKVKKRSFSPEQLDSIGSAAPTKKRSFSLEEADRLDPSGARAAANPYDLKAKFDEMGNKVATPGFFKDALNGLSTGIDAVTGGNLKYDPTFRGVVDNAYRESPIASRFGWAGGEGALALGSLLAPEAPLIMGGLQGLATRPEGAENGSVTDDLVRRAMQSATGASTAGVLKLGSAGAKKVGDWAMQNAVRLPEYIPGMGTRIADEGLIGTRSMMQKQVQNKLAAREAAIKQVLPQIQGNVPAKVSEDAVNREMGRFVPTGNVPVDPGNVAPINSGMDRLIAITKRGDLTPVDALDAFRKIDRGAYDTSVPMGRIQRTFAQADSGAGRSALKDMANAQGLPELAKNLSSEQALINAREGLDRSIPLQENLFRYGRHGAAGTLAAGAMGHGNPALMLGAGGVAALSATPIAMSTGGQVATKLGQALPYTSPAFVDEMVRRAMVGGSE